MTDSWKLYIISARRAHRVPHMAAFGVPAFWVVPQDEEPDYRYTGATDVLPVPPGDGYGLPLARNVALEHAFARDMVCVQSDDDLKQVRMRRSADWAPATLEHVIGHMTEVLFDTGARLAGLPPTANAYFARPGVQDHHFIIGSLMAAAPSEPRFDPDLPLKEDYDFTCQHLDCYGKVARSGDAVAEYAHYSNAGGAVTYRTNDLEQKVTDGLLSRWPALLRPHSRREHELTVRNRRMCT